MPSAARDIIARAFWLFAIPTLLAALSSIVLAFIYWLHPSLPVGLWLSWSVLAVLFLGLLALMCAMLEEPQYEGPLSTAEGLALTAGDGDETPLAQPAVDRGDGQWSALVYGSES